MLAMPTPINAAAASFVHVNASCDLPNRNASHAAPDANVTATATDRMTRPSL
jgi:hypothetical protein